MVTRAQWGARAPKCTTPLPAAKTKGIAVHYSASGADFDQDASKVMRAHQNFHMDGRGWCDIAYNWEIDHRGVRLEGRGWDVRSAAQGTNSGNDGYFACCFQGADRAGKEDFTKEAANAYAELFAQYHARVGHWPDVRPHSDFHATSCPGDEIRAWIALKPWEAQFKPQGRVPAWWWRWAAWRLGEGVFKDGGPRNPATRRQTGAPRVIPPWAWLRLQSFVKARKQAGT